MTASVGTAAHSLAQIRVEVSAAARALQCADDVPAEVAALVTDLGRRIDRTSAAALDPAGAADLRRAADGAVNALRRSDPAARRLELRFALESILDALDGLAEAAATGPAVPVAQLLDHVAGRLDGGRETLAELLGVSTRTLRRWLSGETVPCPHDTDRLHVVARIVDQLRHAFTPAGAAGWFLRDDAGLGGRPIDLLDDVGAYPKLIAAAASSRSMEG